MISSLFLSYRLY